MRRSLPTSLFPLYISTPAKPCRLCWKFSCKWNIWIPIGIPLLPPVLNGLIIYFPNSYLSYSRSNPGTLFFMSSFVYICCSDILPNQLSTGIFWANCSLLQLVFLCCIFCCSIALIPSNPSIFPKLVASLNVFQKKWSTVKRIWSFCSNHWPSNRCCLLCDYALCSAI